MTTDTGGLAAKWRTALLFLCGQIGVMMLARFFFQWLVDFASSSATVDGVAVLLFSAAAVGAVNMGYRIYDAVTDPVVGVLSDRWVASGRERRTLLWFSFLIPSIGLGLVFCPTHTMDPTTRWVVLVIGLTVWYTGYTFYGIPYWSLVDDYSGEDQDQRRRLSNMLGLGVMVATMIGFVVTPAMVEQLGFRDSAVAIGVVAAGLMILPYFAAPRDRRAPSSVATQAATPGLGSLLGALRHRRYLAVLLLFGGSQMSLTIMTAGSPFLAMVLLDGTRGDVAKILGPFLAVSIPSFALVPWLSGRLGWERALVLSCLLLGAIYTGTAVLGSGILGMSPMVTAMLLFAAGGPMIAVLLGLEGEAVCECAREAGGDAISVYFGAYNLIVKALNGLGIWFAAALAGQIRTATAEDAVAWARWIGPSAGMCLAVGVVGYYVVRPRRGASDPA